MAGILPSGAPGATLGSRTASHRPSPDPSLGDQLVGSPNKIVYSLASVRACSVPKSKETAHAGFAVGQPASPMQNYSESCVAGEGLMLIANVIPEEVVCC